MSAQHGRGCGRGPHYHNQEKRTETQTEVLVPFAVRLLNLTVQDIHRRTTEKWDPWWNSIKNPEPDPHRHQSLTGDRKRAARGWDDPGVLRSTCRTISCDTEEMKLHPYLTPFIEINPRCTEAAKEKSKL